MRSRHAQQKQPDGGEFGEAPSRKVWAELQRGRGMAQRDSFSREPWTYRLWETAIFSALPVSTDCQGHSHSSFPLNSWLNALYVTWPSQFSFLRLLIWTLLYTRPLGCCERHKKPQLWDSFQHFFEQLKKLKGKWAGGLGWPSWWIPWEIVNQQWPQKCADQSFCEEHTKPVKAACCETMHVVSTHVG